MKATVFEAGDLRGTIYDFDRRDKIPMHLHPDGETHISIVGSGRVKVWGPGWEQVHEPGAVIDFDAAEEHEIVALDPQTRIVSIQKRMAK